MLWIGIFALGYVVGRYLRTWAVVLLPTLIVGLGVLATGSMAANDSQRGLAVYVALLVAVVACVGEALGRWVQRHRTGRSP